MLPLQGVGVLVTRPELQSDSLCRLLETHGAGAFRLPAIDIRPTGLQPGAYAGQGFDLILFTSVNAVRFGLGLLDARRDCKLGAIGPATARALTHAGHHIAVQPVGGSDSEALLEHAELKRPEGRRLLIVKGRGGRKLLEEELARRGVQVETAEVYERVPAEPNVTVLAAVQASAEAGELHVVTATSVDIGTRLLAIAPPALRGAFEALHWLVPSSRVADELRSRGLGARLLIADSAEDQDLVSALLSWRSAASGA